MSRTISAAGIASVICRPVDAFAQKLGSATSPDLSLVRAAVALLLCLTVAFAAALLLRRRVPTQGWAKFARLGERTVPKQRITVIESRRLSPHGDICLVRCANVDYLIVCGPTQIKLLSQRPTDPT